MLNAWVVAGGLEKFKSMDALLEGTREAEFEKMVPVVVDLWESLSAKQKWDDFLEAEAADCYPQPVLKEYVPPPERTYIDRIDEGCYIDACCLAPMKRPFIPPRKAGKKAKAGTTLLCVIFFRR